MASKTYKAHVLVLKKTKLGEKDLVITMLDESGMVVWAVAKGARKPGGSFAARLELFGEADVLLASGRTLDVVCDARLRRQASASRAAIVEKAACAAPLAEILCNIAQPDLPQPRLFDISKAALSRIMAPDATPRESLTILSASLWKVISQVGFRPSFSRCAICGEPFDELDGSSDVVLSVGEGGIVCANCTRPADAFLTQGYAILWCDALIRSRFDEVLASGIDEASCFTVLQLVRMWARAYTGRDLKSFDFLFTSGLYA